MSTKLKDVSYMSLKEIFDACDSFRIPNYQRGYAWEEEQVEDLKDDITDFINDEFAVHSVGEYFTGTIVLVERTDETNKIFFEVVDGQQRLTSIIILIKTICNSLENHGEDTDAIINEYIRDLKTADQPIKFIPNLETQNFFNRYIIENSSSTRAKSFSHENLEKSHSIFSSWIELKSKEELYTILDTITEKLKFIVYAPSLKTVGMMFETINDRGKHLSELEKLKNYFFYIATLFDAGQLKRDIEQSWGEILINLNQAGISSIKEENSFLIYSYLGFFKESKVKRMEPLHDEFKSKIFNKHVIKKSKKDSIQNIRHFLSFLSKSAESYAYLFNKHYRDNTEEIKEIRETIKYLKCHKQLASVMPLYLSIMAKDSGNKKEDINTKCELLQILEKLNFRLYVLDFVTRQFGKPEISRLASEYYHDVIDASKLKEAMINLILDKSSIETFGEKFADSKNWYRWIGLRYLLGRYEHYLNSETGNYFDVEQAFIKEQKGPEESELRNSTTTLEHIWALKNQVESFGEGHKEKYRLGNFVLMGEQYNSDLKNNNIMIKIKMIEKEQEVRFLHVDELIEIANSEEVEKVFNDQSKNAADLSKIINDIRENRLLEFAKDAWKVDGEVIQ